MLNHVQGQIQWRSCGEGVGRKHPPWKGTFASLHPFRAVIEWRISPTWLTKAAVCSLLVPQSKQNGQVPNLEPAAWSPGLCLLWSCPGSRANRCEEINQTRRPSPGGPFCPAWRVQPAGPAGRVGEAPGPALGETSMDKPCPLSTSSGENRIEPASQVIELILETKSSIFSSQIRKLPH